MALKLYLEPGFLLLSPGWFGALCHNYAHSAHRLFPILFLSQTAHKICFAIAILYLAAYRHFLKCLYFGDELERELIIMFLLIIGHWSETRWRRLRSVCIGLGMTRIHGGEKLASNSIIRLYQLAMATF